MNQHTILLMNRSFCHDEAGNRPRLGGKLEEQKTDLIVPAAANLSDGEDRDIMIPRITIAKHKGRQTTTRQRTKEN